MLALEFWKTVTVDRSGFLEEFLALLAGRKIRYCLVGGQAVNAYAEPVVSLDLDLVVALDQLPALEAVLREQFSIERFPHSLNISKAGSDLRVQIQTDTRYFDFPGRAEIRNVLGLELPVARIEDVLQGKVWAASDPYRRSSKRQKDLADIARLLEAAPELRARVPEELLRRLI